MKTYENKNAQNVLNNVNKCIEELEHANTGYGCDFSRMAYKGWSNKKVFVIRKVYDELSIFDWWNDNLSLSQLKQMKSFLETAIKLGFTGYVCFKVGAKYCSHGMWAHKEESTNGYSPDGDVLFHSFRCGDNYWDMELNGQWMHKKYADPDKPHDCPDFTLKQIKDELAKDVK